MTPSQVLEVYRVASRVAERLGNGFAISRTRLQGWGWTEAKIDALFRAIEKVDDLELTYDAIARDLDERFPSVTRSLRS